MRQQYNYLQSVIKRGQLAVKPREWPEGSVLSLPEAVSYCMSALLSLKALLVECVTVGVSVNVYAFPLVI